METAGYATLSRQSGLMQEMQVVANNIANSATTGFRQEGVIFSEYVKSTSDGSPSLSMARAQAHDTSLSQGALTQTNGTFDLAIEGDGFFMVETPSGNRLTRAGAFSANADGDLVTPDGYRVLDAGEAPIFVPSDTGKIHFASDGTVSADGRLLGQIGLFQATETTAMKREDGVMFDPGGDVEPALNAQIIQGFLEGSNVNPILQISRMIEIQRAYELGQSFLESEDERIRNAVKSMLR
ncbi:flagellar hook-basal body complex protein [Aliisedimentitalea scapharcae]|uniref:Flagellar basal-body rod protein FlgF n=1 Tax=Aliisedimentitalea scapharcae TaxID=1524259 RepID=A0ABZ2XSP0_9RHOB|nr:flagellar hook-basal body complex protein [Rhodobacteraceae bacterium M382]